VLRILTSPPHVNIPFTSPPNNHFGSVVRVAICLFRPDEEQEKNFPAFHNVCSVCGNQLDENERLSALLMPRFESGFEFTMGAWVHSSCFESGEATNEPDPVPW
jgi:hypothetical protein